MARQPRQLRELRGLIPFSWDERNLEEHPAGTSLERASLPQQRAAGVQQGLRTGAAALRDFHGLLTGTWRLPRSAPAKGPRREVHGRCSTPVLQPQSGGRRCQLCRPRRTAGAAARLPKRRLQPQWAPPTECTVSVSVGARLTRASVWACSPCQSPSGLQTLRSRSRRTGKRLQGRTGAPSAGSVRQGPMAGLRVRNVRCFTGPRRAGQAPTLQLWQTPARQLPCQASPWRANGSAPATPGRWASAPRQVRAARVSPGARHCRLVA